MMSDGIVNFFMRERHVLGSRRRFDHLKPAFQAIRLGCLAPTPIFIVTASDDDDDITEEQLSLGWLTEFNRT